MTKTILVLAFLSISAAFQPHSRVPCGRGIISSALGSGANFPVVNDDSYPNILPRAPKGVIFDMDGTLVQHAIDFAEMRERIYAVADEDSIGKDLERDCVLALADMLSCEGQEECKLIFDDIEKRAIDEMKTMHGGPELVKFLRESGLNRAVLTRNLEKNVVFMRDLYTAEIDSGVTEVDDLFHPIVARDTKSHPDNEEP